MSDDKSKDKGREADKQAAEPVDPVALLRSLETKVKLYKLLLIGAFALLLVCLCILLPAYGLIYSKISKMENTSTAELDKTLEKMQLEMDRLQTFRQGEIRSIVELETAIRALREERRSRPITTMKNVFLERETDYQQLADTMIKGMEDIASMVPGKRTWVTFYRNEMLALKARSEAREQVIVSSLMDDMEPTASGKVAPKIPVTPPAPAH